MTKRSPGNSPDRRRFFALAGKAALAAAGMGVLPVPFKKLMGPLGVSEAYAQLAPGQYDLFYAGTDGWIHLESPDIRSASLGGVKTFPDDLAPAPFNTYIFGFRNVTGLDDVQRAAQKNKAQHSAPMFWVDQFDPAAPKDFKIQLTNLGLALRPDLFDAHTIHWHGFRNVITYFDGEPTGSVAVMTGRFFTYVYRPRDPGTYMFHCHVEDTEHVHMGMTGPVFVRPLQNKTGGAPYGGAAPVARLGGTLTNPAPAGAPMGYAYNCGNGSSAYDREFAMFCSEVWGDSHWADSHIQLPEWTDYRPDFSLLNGREYPQTLAPNGSIDPFNPVRDADGDLIAPAGYPELKYQPLSALVTCNAGDRVLLRFANLGFREAAMTLSGIKMKVVGKDATPMKGRDGTDSSYEASTVSFGAGESIDAIFTAPPFTGLNGPYDTYILYDRAYERSNNVNGNGRRTEVRVYALGSLPAQSIPNA